MQFHAGTQAYSLHDPKLFIPPKNATLFPKRFHPLKPLPYATTIPDPSKPTPDGYFGLTAYSSFVKNTSEGLIGAAIIITRTSPSPGCGVGTVLHVRTSFSIS